MVVTQKMGGMSYPVDLEAFGPCELALDNIADLTVVGGTVKYAIERMEATVGRNGAKEYHERTADYAVKSKMEEKTWGIGPTTAAKKSTAISSACAYTY